MNTSGGPSRWSPRHSLTPNQARVNRREPRGRPSCLNRWRLVRRSHSLRRAWKDRCSRTIGEQPRHESIRLRNALNLDRRRFDRCLDSLEAGFDPIDRSWIASFALELEETAGKSEQAEKGGCTAPP